MANQQDSAPSEQQSAVMPPSLLQTLWTRKALILLGAAVGLVIGSLYFVQRKPIYEAAAQVLVVRKLPEVTGPSYDAIAIEDYLSTHVDIIRSPAVVGKAVKVGELNNLPSFRGMDQGTVTAIICGSFGVSRETQQGSYGGPSTLKLVYHGADPEECKAVLSTIIQSYKDFLDERYQNNSNKSLSQLLAANNQLEAKRKQSQNEQNTLRKTGPIMIGKDGMTVNEERLLSLRSKLSNLVIRRVELSSRLEAIVQALKEGRDASLLIETDPARTTLIAATGSPTSPNSPVGDAILQEKLRPFIQEEKELLEKFGPGHPDVRAVHNRIEIMREVWKGTVTFSEAKSRTAPSTRALVESGAGVIGSMASPLDQGPLVSAALLFSARFTTPEVTLYALNLQAQLSDVKVLEKALGELAQNEDEVVRSMGDFRKKDEELHQEIQSTQELLKTIKDKLLQVQVVRETGGFEASVLAEPTRGYQIEPKPAPIFTIALLLGMAAGVALAWVAEVTDTSFRTPDEVRRRMGLPVVGHVPRLKVDGEAQRQHEAGAFPLDPSICAYYQSKSLEAESFRGIRTALYFAAQNDDYKIIQVTSPNMGDGKTTLATNLAVSIAQSGKKILLVDADFRRPRLHRMFGVKAATGLVSVILEEAELLDAIQATTVPNLSLLPCGVRPHNPAELLTSPRFKEVLEALRDKFDLILVDTPPLLAVSDPSVVATQVDGVLLTIRVSKNGRPSAERARDILTSLNANVLGVVVNGVGSRSKEGYGASHYNYHYQYQYAYEPSDNHSYYLDNDADTTHQNGDSPRNGLAGEPARSRRGGQPLDPDAVENGSVPAQAEPRPRRRIPGTQRRKPEKTGFVAGLAGWLRSALWR